MNLQEALELMHKRADELAGKFTEAGVTVVKEQKYLSPVFAELSDGRRARYVIVSLTLSVPGLEEEYEYCLSIGTDMRRGKINVEKLEKSLDEFTYYAEAALTRISDEGDAKEALYKLSAEANEEHEKLVSELREAQKKWQKLNTYVMIGIILAIIVIFVIATL